MFFGQVACAKVIRLWVRPGRPSFIGIALESLMMMNDDECCGLCFCWWSVDSGPTMLMNVVDFPSVATISERVNTVCAEDRRLRRFVIFLPVSDLLCLLGRVRLRARKYLLKGYKESCKDLKALNQLPNIIWFTANSNDAIRCPAGPLGFPQVSVSRMLGIPMAAQVAIRSTTSHAWRRPTVCRAPNARKVGRGWINQGTCMD